MTPAEIGRGIAAYADEQQHLLRWLAVWRDQHEFDQHFADGGDYRHVNPLVPGAFMLGTMHGGLRDWWLDLLRWMRHLDMIEAKEEAGKVWYRAARIK